MYSTPDDVFNPLETAYTIVYADIGARINGIRLFLCNPGEGVAFQIRTVGPITFDGTGSGIPCYSHAQLNSQDVDWLISELTRLRDTQYVKTDEGRRRFIEARAAAYPFKVATDKRGPRVSRLDSRVYGPVVFAELQGGAYKVYLFTTEESARKFKQDYRSYVRSD